MVSPLLKQTWTMSAVLINMFGLGFVLSYPSCLLPALKAPDSTIKLDIHTASWLGSIVGIAGIPGFLTASFLMDLCGRRVTHGLTLVPELVGWLCIFFAANTETLMIGMFLGGFTLSATVSLGAAIIGEYTSPKYRGVFMYLKNASVCLGALVMHAMGRFVFWRTVALISIIPPLISLGIICTWPESPAWLVAKGQYEKSEESFYWLRGNTEESRREINETIRVNKVRMLKIARLEESCIAKVRAFCFKFTQKDFLKPFFIMILATLVLEMSGRHFFPAYAVQIMSSLTNETSESFYYTLTVDIIITSSALSATVLVKIMNRRTLLFATGFSAFAVLMVVCVYLFLASRGLVPTDKPWIPTALLVVYFILANLGCAPIPLALVGEVFPLPHRGQGIAVSGVWIAICLMIGLKATPHMLVNLNIYGFFGVYGIIMFISLLILYFIMPETKDKSLQEIENYFNYGKFVIDDDEEANVRMIKDAK